MNQKLSSKFHSHWVKVKFYNKVPDSSKYKKLSGIRFCEAISQAVLNPVILTKESISCPGAKYAFGWEDKREDILKFWQEKRKISKEVAETILKKVPRLEKSFNYIGLNTDDDPDLLIAYIPPEEVMHLIKIYHSRKGENLDVSLCSMMSVCGGVAVRSYLEEKVSLSFGCDDSRKYSDMRRENLAIGIPRKLFKLFID